MTTRKEKNNPRYETERESMKIHEASKILILGQIVGFTVKRGAVVTSRCHGSKISGSQQTVLLQMW